MTRLVLVPSPLLGPAVWAPVAEELRRRGHAASVAGPAGRGRVARGRRTRPAGGAGARRAGDAGAAQQRRVVRRRAGRRATGRGRGLRRRRPAVERPDDAGGPTGVPRLPRRAGRGRRAAAALDAVVAGRGRRRAVPGRADPGRRRAGAAPSPARLLRRRRADAARAGSGCRPPTSPSGTPTPTSAPRPGRRGWPVETLPGEHLHLLVDPVAVADALVRLLDRD